ncbi:MAG: hypothetical protein GY832_03835 [Chloroflexi bacterium]|nr:hypothetical protein [Chloroflexota bacterium]
MGAIHSHYKQGNLIFYDTYPYRWVDAVGVDITKDILNTVNLPVDNTTGDPTAYTMTVVEVGAGTTTAALSDGALLITTAANEDDGINLQLTAEAFDFATNNLVYFGINFQVSDATQSDTIVGVCITDTTLPGGMTDGIYFECLDGSTDINFVLEKDSTETTSAAAVGTLADATDITLEFRFDGTNVDSFVNGVKQTRLAVTNLPNDEQLTPSIAFLAGEAVAKTMTVNWMRTIQVNA